MYYHKIVTQLSIIKVKEVKISSKFNNNTLEVLKNKSNKFISMKSEVIKVHNKFHNLYKINLHKFVHLMAKIFINNRQKCKLWNKVNILNHNQDNNNTFIKLNNNMKSTYQNLLNFKRKNLHMQFNNLTN